MSTKDYTLETTTTNLTTFNLNNAAFAPILIRSLVNEEAYYRSLTFTTHKGINPLISAAAALIIINARLRHTHSYENIEILFQNLVHEVKVFETRARTLNYRAETIMVARYILCACIDETINQSTFGQHYNWQQRLLNTFQREENAGERFFIILERLSLDPKHHLDLLELIYLCLSLGYEGQYQQMTDGKTKLDIATDSLYQKIRRERHELKPLLLNKISEPLPLRSMKNKLSIKKKLSIFIFPLVLLMSSYILVNKKVDSLMIQLNTLSSQKQAIQ